MTTIPEGATIEVQHFADGDILMRSGSNMVSFTRTELWALVQAAITDGSIPIILNGHQLAISGAGEISATEV